jgi:hypothetical protein
MRPFGVPFTGPLTLQPRCEVTIYSDSELKSRLRSRRFDRTLLKCLFQELN